MALNDKLKVAAKVDEDHKRLNQGIGQLKMWTMKEVSPEDFSDWRLEFIWQLRDFKNQLLKHFDLEEDGGFMNDVIRVAPHTATKVKELRAEHLQMVANLDSVLEDLKTMQTKNQEILDKIRLGISDFVLALRQHEQSEQELIQKAYYREFGGPS